MDKIEFEKKIAILKSEDVYLSRDAVREFLADMLMYISTKNEKGFQNEPFRYEDFTAEQLEGLRGDHGYSAYEIWIGLGNEGTEQDFINSLKGERGERGNDGLVGVSGRDGVSVYAFKADNEEEAIALSRKYRMNIYYWT